MTQVTALEAKTRFGELLERVARGEEIVITRYDKAVARIVPEGESHLRETQRAVDDLLRLRKRIARRKGFRPLTDREILATIREGRR